MKCNLVNENFKSNYVESLLKSKGIIDIEGYFHPTSKYLQSPENLKNIAVGGVLYHRIVSEGGRVLIIVDSDVDGYTSGSIIYQYTKKINPNCQIDYWLHDGKQHGLSDHIGRLMEEKVNYDLLILPDSSSNDAEYHDMLEDISLPCLIIDHHITDVPLSANAVVINNQLSPNYINKDLTGSGMVYQFCRYIDSKYGYNYAEDFIDLAAWGIVGDMGSMISMENRYITYVGLSNIKNNLFKAIVTKQAYSISGKMSPTWDELSEKINPISVAFYVVPMINALIRVGSMEEKELLFTAFIDGTKKIQSHKRGAKPGDLEEAAIEAVRIATNSRNHQNKILEQMEELIDTKIFKYDLLENKVLFVRLEEENFPSELNGLLAMRLAAKYKKPSVVARLSPDGNDKGSGRGLNNSELKDFRKFLVDSGYVVFAQGHPNAFGCSFNDKILSDFHKYANEALKDYNFNENSYDINFERNSYDNDISDLIMDLGKANSIWGQDLPEPLIKINNLKFNTDNIKIMGSKFDTVKIESNGVSYIKFKAENFINELMANKGDINLELIGKANINVWGGRTTPQIFIENYEIKKDRGFDF